MVNMGMKTTVELPAELLRRVKAEAALQGRSFKDLLIEALRDKLRARQDSQRGWRALFGRATTAQVAEVDRRIAQTERIDLEDWK
jgi:hypothetical protein